MLDESREPVSVKLHSGISGGEPLEGAVFLPSPGVPVVLAWKPGPEQKQKNPPPPPRCPVFSLQFKNPLILLLLASALVSVLTKEYEDAVSIAVVSVGGSAGSQTPQPRALQSLRLFYYAKKKSVAVEEKKQEIQQKESKSPSFSAPHGGVLGHFAITALADTWGASSSLLLGTTWQ